MLQSHLFSVLGQAAIVVPPVPPFVLDTFTDVNGTPITSHVGEIGATWVDNGGLSTGSVGVIENDRFRPAGIINAYRSSGVPASPDYYVEGVFDFLGMSSSDNPGLAVRMTPGSGNAGNCYYVRHAEFANNWALNVVIAGVGSGIGTWGDVFNSGSRTCRLEARGDIISVYIDGVLRINAVNGAVAAAGFAGIRAGNITNPGIGRQLTSILAHNL